MNYYPKLPLEPVGEEVGASPELGHGLKISFITREWGACSAVLRNEYGDKVDEIREDSFANAYYTVQLNYPQASWTPEGEEDDE